MRPLSLNHLNLPASDPESLAQWYVDTLGFHRVGRFIWTGGSIVAFRKGEPLRNEAVHFGFLVESRAELAEWTQKLEARGVTLIEKVDAPDYASSFFQDPEGNAFEIFHEPVPAVAAR